MESWKWYVYIIECLDGSYYVGMTQSLPIRYDQHESGFGSVYTKKHGFKALVYSEEYENLDEARQREKQLKGWTRAKKEKLICGEWGKWE